MKKNFLDTNNLPKGYFLEGVYSIKINNNKKNIFLLYDEKNIFIITKRKAKYNFMDEDEPGVSVHQFQMPLTALPWIIDCIENGFWKKPSEGGFSQDVLHVKNTIKDQDLKIRFTPNCGSHDFPGFTIKNYSVPWDDDDYSEIQLSYELLRSGGFLEALKRVRDTIK